MKKLLVIATIYITNEEIFKLADESIKTLVESLELSKVHYDFVFYVHKFSLSKEKFKYLTSLPNVLNKNCKCIVKYNENILSKAWNRGIKYAYNKKYDYVLIPNLDIVAYPSMVSKLIEAKEGVLKKHMLITSNPLQDNPQNPTLKIDNKVDKECLKSEVEYSEGPCYSMFLLSPEEFLEDFANSDVDKENSGKFYEGFKRAYYEDNDMAIRLEKSGFKQARVLNSLFIHRGSATINLNLVTQIENIKSFTKNQETYIKRWGGLPSEEKFNTPYNK